MKKKEFQQLKEKTLAELKELLRSFQAEALKAKLEIREGKIKNVHAHKSARKKIAQVQTLIFEKEGKDQ